MAQTKSNPPEVFLGKGITKICQKCDFNKIVLQLKNTSGWLLLATPVKLKFRLTDFEDTSVMP